MRRRLRVKPGGQAQSQHGGYSVSGAGDIEDLAGHCRRHEPAAGAHQRYALLAEGGDQKFDVEGPHYGLGRIQQGLQVACVKMRSRR